MDTEDYIIESESTESEGGIELDGESWKERDDTTYTSLLDLYGVSDLFSEEVTVSYKHIEVEKDIKEQKLMDYVVSGEVVVNNRTSKDEELIDYIFSVEIDISKVKEYDKEEKGFGILITIVGLFVVLAFCLFMVRFNIKRQNRREKYGIEINMED